MEKWRVIAYVCTYCGDRIELGAEHDANPVGKCCAKCFNK